MEPFYTTGATRCPNSASDIFFTWDVRSGAMRALVSKKPTAGQQELQAASDWCGVFNLRHKQFDTLREASRYVERYNTWFPVA